MPWPFGTLSVEFFNTTELSFLVPFVTMPYTSPGTSTATPSSTMPVPSYPTSMPFGPSSVATSLPFAMVSVTFL